MAYNPLIAALKANAAKGEDYFSNNATVVSYKTGFPVLDYYLGYQVNVYDKDDKLEMSYPSIGIPAGSIVTGIGKPSTGKTTIFSQIAANIVRPFESGFVLHFDLEQSQNYSRIQVLSKFSMSEIEAGKYILRQEKNSINDIKASIVKIYREKIDNPNLYLYNTCKKNEFGEDIIIYQPTVVVIDSIASLATDINENDKKEREKMEEVSSQPDRMRLAGEISRLITELLPILKSANIIVLMINQIKAKGQIGIMPSAADVLYLKQDETLPGGRAPTYYASILLKFTAIGSEKYTLEDNGFDGFGTAIDIIKSRVNQAGQRVELVYDKVRGADSLRSTLSYAKELGLITGNKNKMYFVNDPEKTSFSMVHVHEDFSANKELYKLMYNNVLPVLESRLSKVSDEELEVIPEEYDY